MATAPRLVILVNFGVIEPGTNRLIDLRKGMTVAEADLPPDQSAERWIAQGLAKRAGRTNWVKLAHQNGHPGT